MKHQNNGGEVEPVAWSLQWPDDVSEGVVNAATTFISESEAQNYASRTRARVKVVPLYTHPPAPTQGDLAEAVRRFGDAVLKKLDDNFAHNAPDAKAAISHVRETIRMEVEAVTPMGQEAPTQGVPEDDKESGGSA